MNHYKLQAILQTINIEIHTHAYDSLDPQNTVLLIAMREISPDLERILQEN